MTTDPFHIAGYEALVFKLRQDLQPDLATDIATYSQAAQPPWRPLTLLNGWTGSAAFYVDTTKRLWVAGEIAAGTTNTVAFSFPAGYRPGSEANIPRPLLDGSLTGLVSMSISLAGDATVAFNGTYSGPACIAISFRVEQ